MVGSDSDAESRLEREVVLVGEERVSCGSRSGLCLQDIWFPVSATEFLHVLGQAIRFSRIPFPQRGMGDCFPPARCCEAP